MATAAASLNTGIPGTPGRNPWRSPTPPDLSGRVFNLVNLYRLLLPPAVFALRVLSLPNTMVGAVHARLFITVCAIYWASGFLVAAADRDWWPSRRLMAVAHILLDAVSVGLLLYSSGGVTSGLAILLVVPVAALSVLADGKRALEIAAIAALSILVQQILCVSTGSAPGSDYPLAGMMGAVVFLVAISAMPVSTRLRESEALVRRQEVDLANLAQLSQYIVQRLRESILVIDPSDRIRLINESAARVLGDTAAVPGVSIATLSPALHRLIAQWRETDVAHMGDFAATFVAADGAHVYRPHFAPLGTAHPAPTIIFLEDTGEIAQRLQQTKLAALGRLSASIAHEIRNPVGAISHAAQLIAECSTLPDEERRLTEIMQTNSARVSRIIDSILKLSRREVPRPESLHLAAWSARFAREFCETLQLPPEQLRISPASVDVEIRFDATELHQIVWNLCQNAVHYGGGDQADKPVEILFGRLGHVGRPYLQVADLGPGIAAVDVERIFEPFFTSSHRGTGLGLFLARELASANRSTLLYEPRDGGGSVFRLVFDDINRWTDLDG